ncbi:hypothetical protein LPY66_14375 [Dehalobacter sp. DCM]|uniref:DUF6544 family protein n=1 Tax=Dehalobacter sp. DCM TaxID=2907827 RepID=UPI0030820CCA|nr:hypothetical protein LPY66_14375 [Dehalobacter sp. DCM]
MTSIILSVIALILVIALYFIQPYSPLKSDFYQLANRLISESGEGTALFGQQDIADLPTPIQKYFIHCGYIGTPKMAWLKTEFKNVAFSTGVGKATLKMDYTQYNFVEVPNRLAFIDSALYGIPFQGFDSFSQGKGSMKGVIAKAFTLFDQQGAEMDKACLVTVLAECLYVPNIALQNYITWEAIDDTHAKATINYFGMQGEGIFTFSATGEMLSFTTNDRMAVGFDGVKQRVSWTAVCSDYTRNDNGILKPTNFKAIWHYPQGDHIYFDGDLVPCKP